MNSAAPSISGTDRTKKMEVAELLQKIDAVDFLSQYTDLVENNGEWWGLSPLADPPEKTPSFSVRRESGKFYCFSTGVGGSLITFLQYHDHISAHQAIEMLKKYAGIDDVSYNPREKLAATQICQRFLRKKQQEKACGGKPLPENTMEKYESRPDKLKIWEDEGISAASMEKFGVRYDSFSDRLVYPIRNAAGQIVNVGGRTLDPDFKEKGLRKYTYFYHWEGGINLIYGLSQNMSSIRDKKEIILFEGCKSVLLADTWGIKNTSALLTSHLSHAQMMILAKLGVRVVFALDKDVDVTKDRNINILKRYLNVDYISDTEGLLAPKDAPVDKGLAVFQKLYKSKLHFR